MFKRGIDISGYNPVSNYGLVKNAVDFVILKVIRKDLNPDALFTTHLNGCRNNNIPVIGVYNYSYATSVDKARTDANKVVQILNMNGLNTTVWLDVEDNCQKGLGKKLIDIILGYKQVIESAGYKFGVYTGMSFYNSYIKPYFSYISDVPMWIARYPSSSPMSVTANPPASKKPAITNMVAWQYSSKGQVPGINGNVDLNDYYAETAHGNIEVEDPIDVATYYLKLNDAKETSIVRGLAGVGEKDTSFSHRSKIAAANGIKLYAGTAAQNIQMLNLLKQGKLKKA